MFASGRGNRPVRDNEFRTVRGYELIKQQNSSNGLTPSMEDYLEMIYRLSLLDGYVRVNTLAEMLHVQSPSVTRTVQKLAELEQVKYHRYGIIQLTERGEELGHYLLRRHETVSLFLQNIGAGASQFVDTELIEHHLSRRTVGQLEKLNDWFRQPGVRERFQQFAGDLDEGACADQEPKQER